MDFFLHLYLSIIIIYVHFLGTKANGIRLLKGVEKASGWHDAEKSYCMYISYILKIYISSF